jgi:hypothetical protein
MSRNSFCKLQEIGKLTTTDGASVFVTIRTPPADSGYFSSAWSKAENLQAAKALEFFNIAFEKYEISRRAQDQPPLHVTPFTTLPI